MGAVYPDYEVAPQQLADFQRYRDGAIVGQTVQSVPSPPGAASVPPRANLATTTGRLRTIFGLIEEVDVAPTPQAAAAIPRKTVGGTQYRGRPRRLA